MKHFYFRSEWKIYNWITNFFMELVFILNNKVIAWIKEPIWFTNVDKWIIKTTDGKCTLPTEAELHIEKFADPDMIMKFLK